MAMVILFDEGRTHYALRRKGVILLALHNEEVGNWDSEEYGRRGGDPAGLEDVKKQWGILIVLVVMVWYKMDLLKQLDDMVSLVVGENSLILQVGEGETLWFIYMKNLGINQGYRGAGGQFNLVVLLPA